MIPGPVPVSDRDGKKIRSILCTGRQGSAYYDSIIPQPAPYCNFHLCACTGCVARPGLSPCLPSLSVHGAVTFRAWRQRPVAERPLSREAGSAVPVRRPDFPDMRRRGGKNGFPFVRPSGPPALRQAPAATRHARLEIGGPHDGPVAAIALATPRRVPADVLRRLQHGQPAELPPG